MNNVDNIVKFDVESAEVYDDDPYSQFSTAKILAFISGENRHAMWCSEKVLKDTAPSIYQTPVMYEWAKNGDFGTHSSPGDSFIAGFVVPESAEFNVLDDGRLGLYVMAKVWKKYAPRLIELFQSDNERHVSVEMEINDSGYLANGLLDMKDFTYTGIQILGKAVQPAVDKASITFLSFSQEKEEYEKAYRMEFGNKYSEIDFTIPEQIKKNAQTGLSLYAEKSIGGTSVSLAVARHIDKSTSVSPEKVRSIYKYLSYHKDDFRDKNAPDGAYVSWMLYGGADALEWSKNLVNAMKEKDEQILSYFDENSNQIITFPYKSMKDVNPALKGIDPPITLEQANQIASQADAIGSDDKKNGWAIAIANFKKAHKVEDGHWVKKEKMDDEEEFAKEDHGKGEAIGVNKSKEKLSSTAWGDVDKTELMHKVLNASNYKSLVHDVYLVVESGWEDHPSSSLKYPVMQLVGGAFVYNEGALSAALGRAKGQGETGVVGKVNSIRKKLGLEKSEKEEYSVKIKKTLGVKNAEIKFSLTSGQITQLLNSALSEFRYGDDDKWSRYWVYEFDEAYAYVSDGKENINYRMKYEINNLVASVDEAGKEQVIEGAPLPVDSKPYEPIFSEEDEVEDDDEKPEDKDEKGDTEKMSLDANLDVKAVLAMLEDETEEFKALAASAEKPEEKEEFCGKLMSAMYAKMCKMADDAKKAKEDNDAYMAEFEELKKFKKDAEDKEFAFAVEGVLTEVSDVMPKDEITKAREDAKNFSMETIDAWKNKTKSIAFSFVKKENKSDGITRMDTVWDKISPKQESVWDKLEKTL